MLLVVCFDKLYDEGDVSKGVYISYFDGLFDDACKQAEPALVRLSSNIQNANVRRVQTPPQEFGA